MPITATSGSASATVTPHRPSWADMIKYYPDGRVDDTSLYNQKIGGGFVNLYNHPGYKNTCACRMSYALNRSGIQLQQKGGGTLKGGDGYWYWMRVQELAPELKRRFKGYDEELTLKLIPANLIDDDEAMKPLFKERVRQAQEFLDTKLAGRNGIVVFDVTGWPDATGHFTLWDGSAKKLAFAVNHDDSEKNSYYFWLTIVDDDRTYLEQVSRVRFWELK